MLLATRQRAPEVRPRGRPRSRFFTVVRRISSQFEPPMARAFESAVHQVMRNIDDTALRSAVASGNLSIIEMTAGAGQLEAQLLADRGLRAAVRGASTATGHAGMDIFERYVGVTGRFNAAHPDVVRLAREQIGDLVVRITPEVKESIRLVSAAGHAFGLTVEQQARAIRQVVGLPPNWARAPLNLAKELREGRFTSARRLSATDKAQIRKRLREGTVTESFIGDMQERYRRSLVNRRAKNIARTESLRASHMGQQQSWVQAIEQGIIPPDVRRVWIVTPDDRLAHGMVPGMNPEGRGVDEPFATPEGEFLNPPSRTNCRCGVGLRIPGRPGLL